MIKPERFIIKNENGAFAIDLWEEDHSFNVSAVQVDAKHSVNGFSTDSNKEEAIKRAIDYVYQENKELN